MVARWESEMTFLEFIWVLIEWVKLDGHSKVHFVTAFVYH
jgi:hypothetical protein